MGKTSLMWRTENKLIRHEVKVGDFLDDFACSRFIIFGYTRRCAVLNLAHVYSLFTFENLHRLHLGI